MLKHFPLEHTPTVLCLFDVHNVPKAASYPVEEGNVVKQVRVGKGDDTQALAELWTLVFREPGQRGHREPQRASAGEDDLGKALCFHWQVHFSHIYKVVREQVFLQMKPLSELIPPRAPPSLLGNTTYITIII